MDMLSGRNPYMFAALKSLPLLPESEDLYAAHVASLEPTTGGGGGIPSNNMSGGGGSGVGGSGVGGSGDSTSTLASGGGVGTSNGGGVVLGSGVRRWIAQRRDLDQATAEQLEATKRAAKLLLLQATTELRGMCCVFGGGAGVACVLYTIKVHDTVSYTLFTQTTMIVQNHNIKQQ